MPKIYFTLDQANALLKEVEPKARNLQKLYFDAYSMNDVQVAFNPESIESQLFVLDLNKKRHKLLYEFFELMEEFTKKGIIVKDLGKGLFDFYSKRDKQDILLCWQIGEKEIAFFHDERHGFGGRQPVTILKKEYEERLKKLL